MKKIALMGSTGSVGTQTLDVVRKYPDKLQVFALATHSNIALLEEQIAEFHPVVVGVADVHKAEELRQRLATKIDVVTGDDMLQRIAVMDGYDTFISATVGLRLFVRRWMRSLRARRLRLPTRRRLWRRGRL